MPLPAFVLPTVGAFILNKFLGNAFSGGNRGVPANVQANPLNDSAIRASLASQGLATPTGDVPGSNVPAVQTNTPSLANQLSGQTGVGAGVNPAIPTRPVLGLGGDQALASTAQVFREQLSRQLGTEIGNINREFAGARRFDSGQRGAAIERAQEGAREQFGRFFASTALERFLQEQRLSSAERIAQAQLDQQGGSNRAQLLGSGVQSAATIFASNPSGFIDFFRDLFTRSGGKAFESDFHDKQLEGLFGSGAVI